MTRKFHASNSVLPMEWLVDTQVVVQANCGVGTELEASKVKSQSMDSTASVSRWSTEQLLSSKAVT